MSSTLDMAPAPTSEIDKEETKDHVLAQVKHVPGPVAAHSASYGDPLDLLNEELDPEEERATVRRVDWNIGPLVGILYLISFLDRSNLSNAYVGGMGKDLHFPANGLSVCASIFYVTYVLFETPATLVLRTLRPSIMIPTVTVLWGAIVLSSGFAKNYATIVATRLLLGLLESSLSPCLFLYMTTFYQRSELAARSAYLYVAGPVSGIVGGLIATGFIKMDGIHGLRGWQWLYIIEGAITMGIGLVVFFVMPDNYHHSRFLTRRQKHIMAVREAKNAEYFRDEGFSWAEIRSAMKDPMIHLAALSQLLIDTTLYGYATFLVVIINQLGYGPVASQGLTAPGYALGAIAYIVAVRIMAWKNSRFWVALPLMAISCVGYAILLGARGQVGAGMAGAFITGTGIYLAVGVGVTWLNLNVAGYRRRSFASGYQQTIGNCGGIIAGQIYRSTDKPRYVLGNAFSLACMFLAMVVFCCQYTIWKSRNAARDNMTQDDKDEQDAKGVKGDHHWSFRYAL